MCRRRDGRHAQDRRCTNIPQPMELMRRSSNGRQEMTTIKIKCEAEGTGYWLALDKTDLTLVNGEVTVSRVSGIYYLAWWMVGKPGDAIKIEASLASGSIGKIETK